MKEKATNCSYSTFRRCLCFAVARTHALSILFESTLLLSPRYFLVYAAFESRIQLLLEPKMSISFSSLFRVNTRKTKQSNEQRILINSEIHSQYLAIASLGWHVSPAICFVWLNTQTRLSCVLTLGIPFT